MLAISEAANNQIKVSDRYTNPTLADGYKNIYTKRLAHQKQDLIQISKARWPDSKITSRFYELVLAEERTRKTNLTVFGLVVRDMAKRYQATEIYANLLDPEIQGQLFQKMARSDDLLYIEDGASRLEFVYDERLTASEGKTAFAIPGSVIALNGHINDSDQFVVCDFAYPISTRVLTPDNNPSAAGLQSLNCGFLGIVSGLLIGSTSSLFSQESLGRFMESPLAAKMQKLVIGGNFFEQPENTDSGRACIAGSTMSPTSAFLNQMACYTEGDAFLARLLGSTEVLLMPGYSDPCGRSWPQQGFSQIVFQRSFLSCVDKGALTLSTNPLLFSCKKNDMPKVIVYCTDGINVSSIAASVTEDLSDIDCLEACLRSGIIAPTAPMILDSQPISKDIFLLERLPDIMIACNCREFSRRLVSLTHRGDTRQCLLLTVPSFARTGQLVLLEPYALETQLVQLK